MNVVPANVIEAVNCMLRPYGVRFSEQPETVNGKYMTAKQASAYCGLSAKTIRDKALSGEIGSIKLGNTDKSRVLIVKADLDNWLEGCSNRKTTMA